ncbi:hypothetical protein ACFQZF_07760 [Flavobacterium myungsuense]|uniref:hypothetical protein n=1 Tax=Flavobacterium myungsuense TaxID=651823 RepID=UPI00362AFD80
MKKLNSNQLNVITKVFAALTLITILLQVGLDWNNWIEHPKMPWLPLLFMFISVIVLQKAKSKKRKRSLLKENKLTTNTKNDYEKTKLESIKMAL